MGKWAQNALVAETTRKVGRVTAADLTGFDAVIVRLGGSENAPFSDPYPGYTERIKNPYWDDELDFTIQAAYDAPNPDGTKGIPCGVSYVVGPRVYTEAGIDAEDYAAVPNEKHPVIKIITDRLRLGLKWKAVHFVMFVIDDSSLNMSGGYGVGPKDIAAYIDDVRERIVALRKTAAFPNIPFGFMSRASLIAAIDAKDPKTLHVGTWFENNVDSMLETAYYPGVKVGPVTDPAVIRAAHMPTDTTNPKPWGYSPKRELPDALYPGWSFWNYCGYGSPHRFALTLFNGTRAELWSLLKFKQTAPPPPPPPPDPDPEPSGDLANAIADIAELKRWRIAVEPIVDRADRHLAE